MPSMWIVMRIDRALASHVSGIVTGISDFANRPKLISCVFYRNISSTANPSSPRVQTLAADLSFATGIRFNN